MVVLAHLVLAACSSSDGATPASTSTSTGGAAGASGSTSADTGGATSGGAGGAAGTGGDAAGGSAGNAGVTLLCPGVTFNPSSPMAYGLSRVATALGAAASQASVCAVLVDDPMAAPALAAAGVTVDPRPESYAVVPTTGGTLVVGSDAVGALYGLLEIEERIHGSGAAVLPPATPWTGAPRLPFRAANLFLTLQRPDEPSWWFYDTGYWTEYLDLLARSRIDVLDLHGMWNPDNTVFPNVLLRFATSPSFPDVGAPPDERQENVAMLQKIVSMAATRGVRVSLMTYSSSTSLTGDDAGVALAAPDLATYTREAARDLATSVPKLERLGFRIGEGGHDAQWFTDNLVAGVKDAGTGVRVYTRTWLTSKADVMKVVAAGGPDTVVEAKFNGEQLGPSYAIAGGLMAKGGFATWDDYSYQDFLDGEHPYRFVFQVRAGGTHRLFRYGSFERTKQVMATIGLGASQGFSLEAAHAFLEQRDVYHVDDADRFSTWMFRRDELSYLLFGRLGYDPSLDDGPFRQAVSARAGTDALWPAMQAAGEIVPWIQAAMTCGPDQRHYAPDLEWGGTVDGWIGDPTMPVGGNECQTKYFGPFDRFAIASPREAAAELASGSPSGRLTPLDVAAMLDGFVATARTASMVAIGPGDAEARDLVRECVALADLGDYHAHKLRAAAALALALAGGEAAYGTFAEEQLATADAAWTSLAQHTAHLAAFEEHLRMKTLGFPTYHWSMVAPLLANDPKGLAEALAMPHGTATLPPLTAWQASAKGAPEAGGKLDVTPNDPAATTWTMTFASAGSADGATLWWKSFDGEAEWASVPMTKNGDAFTATLAGTGVGALFAVGLHDAAGARRWPDPRAATPYVVLAPP